MNSDLPGGVYIKCWEMFWVSSYKYQQAAVEADWLCGVGEAEPLLDREQADINTQRNVHKRVQVVFHGRLRHEAKAPVHTACPMPAFDASDTLHNGGNNGNKRATFLLCDPQLGEASSG